MIATSTNAQAPQSTLHTQARTEFVATQAPPRKVKRSKARTGTAPPHTVWTGPDPTKGPGIERLRQLQREGRCVIDEGYGRFTYCSDR